MLIRNGLLCDAIHFGSYKADILVKNGKVVKQKRLYSIAGWILGSALFFYKVNKI